MRRIALFSDVHGNLPALDAVLADIAAAGIAETYCLGDLVGYGPDPAGVIARIREAGIPTILGNYDEGVGNRRGECGCYYATEQAKVDGAASYAFTDAALDDRDHDWLAALPMEVRLQVGDARILLTHGSPRRINEYLLPDRTDAQLVRLATEAHADVVCVGHVHVPYHRRLTAPDGGTIHYISSGSVGKPKDGDPRAAWVELRLAPPALHSSPDDPAAGPAPHDPAAGPIDHGGLWLTTTTHRVTYDVESVAREMVCVGLPPTLAEALRTA